MKDKTQNNNVVYHNSKADKAFATEVPKLNQQIKTNSHDLALKELPRLKDSLKLYLQVITSLFQVLLENIHQIIGAKRAVTDKQSIEQSYAKEEAMLTTKHASLQEDLRVLKKQEREFNSNLGHLIRNWRIALFFLVLLSFSEIMINFKIFLLISSTSFGALVSSTGLAICFFIIAHIFPDVIAMFETKLKKWLVGLGIITFVSGLLYSFSALRLSYNANLGQGTEHTSEFNFLIINLTLFLCGVLLTLMTKPTKQTFSDYYNHKKIGDQIKVVTKEFKETETRLTLLLKEKNDKLSQLDGILLMAHSYEKVISAEYMKAFAMWCNENLITRKDKVQPNAFSETPTPLTTYFDNVEFQNYTDNQKTNS